MIIGSGLLAKAFSLQFELRRDVCIYAAGVSNSHGMDFSEFERERLRLATALQTANDVGAFVYFGTCSVADPESQNTHYVQHKLAMEQLVAQHPKYLILRLPQVAGCTPNPHILLNYLYARIARSEAFSVWRNAYRNVIDVYDIATLSGILIEDIGMRNCIMNLANTESYSMPKIVSTMEQVVGKKAIFNVVERGSHYAIDVAEMLPILAKTDIRFNQSYLKKVLKKYYEKF
jgi:nucleoside-diphosphate-sugar epimerase